MCVCVCFLLLKERRRDCPSDRLIRLAGWRANSCKCECRLPFQRYSGSEEVQVPLLTRLRELGTSGALKINLNYAKVAGAGARETAAITRGLDGLARRIEFPHNFYIVCPPAGNNVSRRELEIRQIFVAPERLYRARGINTELLP